MRDRVPTCLGALRAVVLQPTGATPGRDMGPSVAALIGFTVLLLAQVRHQQCYYEPLRAIAQCTQRKCSGLSQRHVSFSVTNRPRPVERKWATSEPGPSCHPSYTLVLASIPEEKVDRGSIASCNLPPYRMGAGSLLSTLQKVVRDEGYVSARAFEQCASPAWRHSF